MTQCGKLTKNTRNSIIFLFKETLRGEKSATVSELMP